MEHQNNTIWEKIGEIGILTLNNPPENFIKDPEFISPGQLDEILGDESLKGLIIKGAGRHFSAGADLENLRKLIKNEAELTEKMSRGKGLIRALEKLEIPVVAAIKGVCFGAGLEIALACHTRICAENTLFAFPESNHGIMPGLGGTITLSRLIGEGRSAEMILSGEMVNAEKALDLHLADHIVPAKELLDFSLNYLGKMTSDRDIFLIRSIMRSIRNSMTLSFENALEEETKLFCGLAVRNMGEE